MIHLEGRTLIQLNNDIENDAIGPSTKDFEKIFYNPAMSGSRTRSIILMKHMEFIKNYQNYLNIE